MDRFSFRISENNRRRLEILRAFSVLDGKNPTLQDLVNESIEQFFIFTYERYCLTNPSSDYLGETMEGMLPKCSEERTRPTPLRQPYSVMSAEQT